MWLSLCTATALSLLGACVARSGEEGEPVSNAVAADSAVSAIVEPASAKAGLTFPHIVQPACPGEGCSYGEWMPCEVVPAYATLGDTTAVAFDLADRERFEVETGAVWIERPGVVVVTRPKPRSERGTDAIVFQPGDTLLVLDYIGEGYFNVLHRDTIVETEVFWRTVNFAAPDSFYRAEVLAEGMAEFWIRIRSQSGREGWVRTNGYRFAAAYSLVDKPLECYEEPGVG